MTKLKSEQLARMIESLKEMSDLKYNQVQNWKYLNFTSTGDYIGCSHFVLMPNLIHFPPFQVKQDSIRYLEFLIENPYWADNVPLTTKVDIDNLLDSEWVDNSTRLNTFFKVSYRLEGELYWYGLRKAKDTAWKCYYYRHELRRAFLKDEPEKETLMTEGEHEVFYQLPNMVNIYRITGKKERDNGDYGVSWTLRSEIAEDIGKVLFKNIFFESHMAVKALTVPKSNLLAFWDHRHMQELIYVPQN